MVTADHCRDMERAGRNYKVLMMPTPKVSYKTELAYQLAKKSQQMKLDIDRMLMGYDPFPNVKTETDQAIRNHIIHRSYIERGKAVWDVGAEPRVHAILKQMENEGFLTARFQSGNAGTLAQITLTAKGMEEGQIVNTLREFRKGE